MTWLIFYLLGTLTHNLEAALTCLEVTYAVLTPTTAEGHS